MKIIGKVLTISAVCICVIFAVKIIATAVPTAKSSYDVVFLGDSIFGNYRDDTSIPSQFAESTGLSSYNGGMGGTYAGLMGGNSNTDILNDCLSLVYVVNAIKNHDFSEIKAALPARKYVGIDYYAETIDGLEAIDYDSVKYIIIEHGLNDYFGGQEIYSDSDVTDVNTYEGALLYAVQTLKENCPDAIIVLASPVYGMDDLSAYAAVASEVAEKENIYYFDAYNQGIVTPDNVHEVTEDDIHLNEIGRRAYAEALSEYFEGIADK